MPRKGSASLQSWMLCLHVHCPDHLLIDTQQSLHSPTPFPRQRGFHLSSPICSTSSRVYFAAADSSESTGSQSVNIDPLPSSLSSSTMPPMSAARRREIGKPSPVPRSAELPRGPASTCSNSSKIRV